MNATTSLDRKVTRKNAVRRGDARIVLKDGTTVTGQLTAWGSQVVEFAPDAATQAAGRFTWKRNPLWVGDVASVYQA